jgi:hypothetical protein
MIIYDDMSERKKLNTREEVLREHIEQQNMRDMGRPGLIRPNLGFMLLAGCSNLY